MIRKALLTIAILIAVLIVAFALALLNANSLIAKYQPHLEETISQALGAKVNFREVETNALSTSPRLCIRELSVSGSSKEPPFTLRDVSLHLKLLPLLSRRLEVTKLSIQTPLVTLIKDKNGVRLSGWPEKTEQEKEHAPQPKPREASKPKEAQALGLNVNLQKAEIQDATIVLKDTQSNSEYSVTRLFVEAGLSLAANNISVSNLKVSAKALGKADVTIDSPQITLSGDELKVGTVLIKTADSTLSLSGSYNLKTQAGDAVINGQELKLAGLSPFFPPAVKELSLGGSLKPTLKADLGPGGLTSAQGNVEVVNLALNPKDYAISNLNGILTVNYGPELEAVRTSNLEFLLNNQPIKAAFDATLHDKTAEVKNLTINAFGGTIEKTAIISLAGEKTFAANTEASKLRLEQLLSALAPAKAKLASGTLEALKVKAEGNLNNVPSSLRGSAYIAIKEGTLKGFNLAGDVLKAVSNIPFLAGTLYNAVPTTERNAVDSNDTIIESLAGNLSFSNSTVATRDLQIVSTIFSLAANGNIGFDSSLDLNATIYFDKNFSAALAAKTKELNNLLDADGRLVIPLTLKGTPPKVIVLPNIQKLLEIGAKKAMQQKAGELVQGILGGKQKSSSKGLGGLLSGLKK